MLRRTAQHEGLSIVALLGALRTRLWRSAADPDRIAHRGGVLAAAAGNRHGVPTTGAVRCVRYLLTLPQDAAEVARARARCERFASERAEVLELLCAYQRAHVDWRDVGAASGTPPSWDRSAGALHAPWAGIDATALASALRWTEDDPTERTAVGLRPAENKKVTVARSDQDDHDRDRPLSLGRRGRRTAPGRPRVAAPVAAAGCGGV